MTNAIRRPAWRGSGPMRSLHDVWRTCALAVLVLGSFACGSNTDVQGNAAAASGPVASAAADAPTTSSLPDALRFTSPLVGGGSIDGASLAGRPTVLWFWAPT